MRLIALLLFLLPAAAHAQDPYAPFEPGTLTRDELRTIQAGLVLSGDYGYTLDGAWGPMSAGALDAFTRRDGSGTAAAVWLDALMAADAAAEEIERGDWIPIHFETVDLSFQYPRALLAETDDIEATWATGSRDLLLRIMVKREDETRAMHGWLFDEHDRGAGLTQSYESARMISHGRLPSGRIVHLVSHPAGAMWVTALVQYMPGQTARGDLIVASLMRGPQTALGAAPSGTLGKVAELARTGLRDPVVSARQSRPLIQVGSGSGFFVDSRHVVSNAHVVLPCSELETTAGQRLSIVEADEVLDLALLTTDRPSDHWVSIRKEGAARLAAPIIALGYPFGEAYHDGLAAASGIVSALSAQSMGGTRMMISAPIQPGNSGGPVMTMDGEVVGVVVSRLGSSGGRLEDLPQNMNYAVPVPALRGFLDRARVRPAGERAQPIDLGLPEGIDDAIVHIRCLR